MPACANTFMDLRLPPPLAGALADARADARGDARADGSAPAAAAAAAAWANERFSLQLLRAALGGRGLAESAAAVATDMAREWVCERVFVGVVESRFARVVALSHSGPVLDAQPLMVDVAQAMDEALDQGAHVACPQHPDERPRVSRAHAQLAQRHGLGALLTVPLFVDTQPVGALMFERRAGQLFDNAWAQQVQAAAELLAPLLQLQVEQTLSPLRRSRRLWQQRWRALPAQHRQIWLAAAPVGLLVALGLLFVPLVHEVAAPSTLQGRVQRAVVSPLDGYLKAVHVRAGDNVKAGDVLAELVDDDLRLELRRRQIEVTQHESAYGDAMARQDRTALVLAEARAAEARAQLGLVEAQLARTRLLAPFDGQVIAGDLQQQLAAPLRRGELLFTLTPTRELRLLLQVDERDSAHVQAGQSGMVSFSALPAQRFDLVVERLSPVAQTSDGRNVFEAEARLLHAPQDLLRPGMQGLAQLQAGKQPLGWLLGHGVTDWLRLQWWRWIG